MPVRKSETLSRPNTVAYLVAHVEWLTKEGVFKDQQAARTVFLHLCCHPNAQVPHPDKQSEWRCPVDEPHHEPAVIAAATGVTARHVRRAIDWLEDEGLIKVDREGSGQRKVYGPVTIVSTNRSSDWRHRIYRPQGHHVPIRPVLPAQGHHVPDRDTTSLSDDSTAPKRTRRTVAATRSTWANTNDFEQCATIESPPSGALAGPSTRSAAGAPGGRGAQDRA